MMVYEIFKTLNNLNPVFMKDIFHYSPNVTHKKHLYIHTQNTPNFGDKSLRAFGANIYGTHCQNILNRLLHFWNWKNSLKRGLDQNTNAAYANEQMRMKLPLKHDNRYAQHFAKMNSECCHAYECSFLWKQLKTSKAVIPKRSTLGIWWGSEHASSFASYTDKRGEGSQSRSIA